jgi:hypothetical protein
MRKKQSGASKNVKAKNRNMVTSDEDISYAVRGKIAKTRGSAQHFPLFSGCSYLDNVTFEKKYPNFGVLGGRTPAQHPKIRTSLE